MAYNRRDLARVASASTGAPAITSSIGWGIAASAVFIIQRTRLV